MLSQSIHTAPRDGTKIHIHDSRNDRVYEAFWYVDSANVLSRHRTAIGVWMLSGGGWFDTSEEEFLTWDVVVTECK